MESLGNARLPRGRWSGLCGVKKQGQRIAQLEYNPLSETPYRLELPPLYFKTSSEVQDFCNNRGWTIHNTLTGEEVDGSEL